MPLNMIGYDVYDYDRFTMKHFPLRQRVTLMTKIYCSRLYIQGLSELADQNNTVNSSSSGKNRKNVQKNLS
jgi:hypothetical protein